MASFMSAAALAAFHSLTPPAPDVEMTFINQEVGNFAYRFIEGSAEERRYCDTRR